MELRVEEKSVGGEGGVGLQLGPFEICKAYKLCAWAGRQTANESKDNPIYFTLCPTADTTKCGSNLQQLATCLACSLTSKVSGCMLHFGAINAFLSLI